MQFIGFTNVPWWQPWTYHSHIKITQVVQLERRTDIFPITLCFNMCNEGCQWNWHCITGRPFHILGLHPCIDGFQHTYLHRGCLRL